MGETIAMISGHYTEIETVMMSLQKFCVLIKREMVFFFVNGSKTDLLISSK